MTQMPQIKSGIDVGEQIVLGMAREGREDGEVWKRVEPLCWSVITLHFTKGSHLLTDQQGIEPTRDYPAFRRDCNSEDVVCVMSAARFCYPVASCVLQLYQATVDTSHNESILLLLFIVRSQPSSS